MSALNSAFESLTPGIRGPCLIGATGGSGTRVVARIVRAGGVYLGKRLNVSEDALVFGDYSDRWINHYMRDARSSETLTAMVRDLEAVLEEHLEPLDGEARAWGWKEPRCSFLLPFFHSCFPVLKFLHVVRDGRDMAYSSNQNQLSKHRGALLGPMESAWTEPMQSIALWTRLNSRVADYGEQFLPGQYARIRFEDLCLEPVETIRKVFEFFALEGDVDRLARLQVSPPDSLGRWRKQESGTIEALDGVAAAALRRFGYDV